MIQLHTLGAVNLRRDGIDVRSVLSQPRRLALLVYLATARPRGFQSRDRLMGLFWPESDETRARNSLRQAVHHLRRSLGAEVLVGRGDREIGLDASHFWCDAAALDEALEAGRAGAALELYRGDFMPGFFIEESPEIERFIEDERLRLRRGATASAWSLAAAEEAKGDLGAAAAMGRQALALEPLDEASLRRLIDLLDRSGERVAALQTFDDFARRLQAEYEIGPSDDTLRLVDRLRAPSSASPPAETPLTAPREQTAVRQSEQTAIGRSDATGTRTSHRTEVGPSERTGGRASEGTAPPGSERTEARAAAGGSGPIPVSAGSGRDGPAALRGRGRWRWRHFGVVAAVSLLALIAVFRGPLRGSRETAASADPPAPAEPAIAVLPFLNMSGDPANEYFADGLAEELTYALSRVRGIRIVGHTSAFSFKGKDVGLDSIGRALRVEWILEGSVRTTGNRARIVAQLIDAASGYHAWSDTWDAELDDVFEVQNAISAAVVGELQPRLVASAFPANAGPETRDPQAHADVLRGYQALFAGEIADYARADTFFSRALARDPDYARAHTGLAAVQMMDAYRGRVPRDAGFAAALASASRAIELDPDLAAAHSVMGRIVENGQWDFQTADRHYRRAIELSPGSETWYRHRALLLALIGRHEEAIAHARRAVELDPLATGAHRQLGTVLFRARRYEEAVASYRNALTLTPDHGVALADIARALSMLDRHDEAISAIERALERSPDDAIFTARAGWIRARAGDAEGALAALRQVQAGPRPSPWLLALLNAALGEPEPAFDLLEQALQARDPLMVELLIHPAFDAMRGDPRMDRLLREAGLL